MNKQITALIKFGRVFYGIAIVAFGIQQLLIVDFRPEILPPFPAWAHEYSIFPIITGIAFIITGILISGLFRYKAVIIKELCLWLGFYFLVLILICHLPYTLIFSPNKASHLGVWAEALKELAFCGGAFVMADSFSDKRTSHSKMTAIELILERIMPLGRIFFSTTMILYGCSHFVYTDYVKMLVPAWFGSPVFWTYFGGAALIAAGIAIVLKIWIRSVAFLLATMLFLWFIFLHVPDAIAHPYSNNGNEVVSAFDALMFCGISLVIASINGRKASTPD